MGSNVWRVVPTAKTLPTIYHVVHRVIKIHSPWIRILFAVRYMSGASTALVPQFLSMSCLCDAMSKTEALFGWKLRRHHLNKVITTMVIRPLNDRTSCVRFALTHLGLWRKLYDCSMHHFRTRKFYQTCCINVFIDLQPFSYNMKGRLRPIVWGLGKAWRFGIGRFDSPPWAPIRSPLTLWSLYLTHLGQRTPI